MRFRDWMEACLYDPEHGYYTAPGRSPTGTEQGTDFATSPTLHPFLARCVGAEVDAARRAVEDRDAFGVFEFGGGRGDLARDALAYLEEKGRPSPWTHVEAGPRHREQQAGPGVASAGEIPHGVRGLVVAHEFLDALPFHWLERRKSTWAEIGVTVDEEGRFSETYMIPDAAALEAAPRTEVAEGQRVAVMVRARDWLQDVASRVESGRVLVVDYGADDVWRRDREAGTVRTFKEHQEAGDPLEAPGTKDITASLDFRQIRAWAEAAGFTVVSEESQEEFLLRHGVLDELNAQERDSVEGASRYLRLRQMLIPHAGGMGHAFRVLILET